jgi:hypothetical protein
VPLIRAYLHYGVLLNNVSHLVEVRGAAVGPEQGGTLDISTSKQVGDSGSWAVPAAAAGCAAARW